MQGRRSPGVSLLLLLWSSQSGLAAEMPRLLADLNTQSAGEDDRVVTQASGFVEAGDLLVFSTADPQSTDEGMLWSTDGTAEGTRVVSSTLCPAPCLQIAPLTVWRGAAILKVASGPARGYPKARLWRTDGTAQGTWPFTGFLFENSYSLSSPEVVAPPDAPFFFFVGCLSSLDCTIWRSDGTRAGTTHLAAPRFPRNLAFWAGKLYFLAYDDEYGFGLWSTDGTEEGTSFLSKAGGAQALVLPTPSRLYFSGESGEDLWVTDGTAEGTRRLADLEPPPCWGPPYGCDPPDINSLAAVGEAVYFVTHRSGHGTEIWRSDGTESGTRPLIELPPGVPATTPDRIGEHWVFSAQVNGQPGLWTADGELSHAAPMTGCDGGGCPIFRGFLSRPSSGGWLFVGEDAAHGAEIWVTDGTGGGTRRLSDACPGPCSGHRFLYYSPSVLGSAAGRTYFRAYSSTAAADGSGDELWVTDRTVAGTQRLAGHASALGFFGGLAWFATAGSAERPAAEIWATDGTPAGTRRVTALRAFAPGSSPSILAVRGGVILAPLGDPIEIWKSDGRPEGTVKVSSLGSSRILGEFTRVGPQQFFDVYRLVNSRPEDPCSEEEDIYLLELWRTNGKPGGTRGVAAFSRNDFLDLATSWNDKFLFTIDGRKECVFWTSDGTPAGTREILPDLPGIRCPTTLLGFGDRFLFVARVEEPSGPVPQIFLSDGTLAGTRQISRIRSSREPLDYDEPVLAGGIAFFRIYAPHDSNKADEAEVWRTDGTPEGTRRAFRLRGAADLHVYRGSLYLTAFVGAPGEVRRGLFKVSAAGGDPVLLRAFTVEGLLYPYSPPAELTPAGDRLFFVAQDEAHGSELWVTDGTPAGTRLVFDVRRGPVSSAPAGLVAAGARIYFSAEDGEHGRELWTSDGTPEGTRMVVDLNPSGFSSSPEELTVSNGHLFFRADDGQVGVEPWALRLEP